MPIDNFVAVSIKYDYREQSSNYKSVGFFERLISQEYADFVHSYAGEPEEVIVISDIAKISDIYSDYEGVYVVDDAGFLICVGKYNRFFEAWTDAERHYQYSPGPMSQMCYSNIDIKTIVRTACDICDLAVGVYGECSSETSLMIEAARKWSYGVIGDKDIYKHNKHGVSYETTRKLFGANKLIKLALFGGLWNLSSIVDMAASVNAEKNDDFESEKQFNDSVNSVIVKNIPLGKILLASEMKKKGHSQIP